MKRIFSAAVMILLWSFCYISSIFVMIDLVSSITKSPNLKLALVMSYVMFGMFYPFYFLCWRMKQ